MKAERRMKIHVLLQEKPFISLKELSELFPDVTSMTLRRDIEYFEKQGELIRVRNGARSMKFIAATADKNYIYREKENESAKRSIALAAAEFLEKGSCVFFDAGSTIMQLADIMPDKIMNILTSGPNISMKLIQKQNPIVTLIGGILNRESISVSGDISIDALNSFSIDTAFTVPSGYSKNSGFTCGNLSECELKKYVVKNSRRVIMLIDSSKYGKEFPYSFCQLADINLLITDSDKSKYMPEAELSGVTVISTGISKSHEHISHCIPVEV